MINILYSKKYVERQINWCRSVYFVWSLSSGEKKGFLRIGYIIQLIFVRIFCTYSIPHTCAPTHWNYLVQHMCNRKAYWTSTTPSNIFTQTCSNPISMETKVFFLLWNKIAINQMGSALSWSVSFTGFYRPTDVLLATY